MPSKRELQISLSELLKDMELDSIVVLVEGAHDCIFLRRAGFNGVVIEVSRKPIIDLAYRLMEKYRNHTIVILTDFDEQGEKKAKRLSGILSELGLKINHRYRKEVRKIARELGVKTIEGLARLYSRL
ncbi:MAG: hypothetical protein DRN04_05605 [Thermoprotei archaeon]|nr:MAG: hypothetical protein DRN04_05605 [Thermoprotei archaeon]